MGKIRVLPDNVANKIAAGEVVERPASVVKELLENSLDAGASRVRVEVSAGGRKRIRVSDDGCGMGQDDALLAFERHATSKLRDASELLAIATLGFRGEALPSIASVSRLTLETRAAKDETGTRVEIHGGRMQSVEPAALPAGTTVTVQDLFYNIPARRKFLRTEKTELAHVAALVTHYSLAHTGRSFQLLHDKDVLLSASPVASLRERVFQVFGSDTLERLVALDGLETRLEAAGSPGVECFFRMSGFVSEPGLQKLNRNSIYIFVNRRLVRDRLVLKALNSAYHNILPPGSYPFALLFLDLPPEEVDVNVHPSKTEVRFRRPGLVYDFVRDSVRARLVATKPVSSIPPAEERRHPAAQPAVDAPFSEASLLLQSSGLPPSEFSLNKADAPPPRLEFSGSPVEVAAEVRPGGSSAAAAPPVAGERPPAGAGNMPEPREDLLPADDAPHSAAPLADPPSGESLADLTGLRVLGQIKESFIVAASADGLWIIDQHVAHERILFEKVLRERFAGHVSGQRLLMPLILTLKPDQQIVLSEIEEEFRANGFDIEPFGHRTIAVKGAPAGLSPPDVEALIQEILDTPERERRALSLNDLQKRLAAGIACRAAIKINTPLEFQKMRWLLDELARTDCPMACPHGRPIVLKYSLKAILKAFHRL